MRVLLVEDDELLGDGARAGLLQVGYSVDWLKDGLAAKHALETETFDIIVLDLGLPKLAGLELLRHIRAQGVATPVIILTARESVEDKIKGLDAGADDYISKPFDLDELYARIRALLRRRSNRAQPIIAFANLELDPASHTVKCDNELVSLPRREFALLHKLLENAGQVLSRDQLMQSLYSWDEEVDSNTLEVHIHNLRKKLDADYIRTIRGVGYMVEKR
ncbi:MAG: response regulator [Gammaproteobacteria bacterium]|jgi:two-component system response regulator QseB|nr:response regulator [Gammaproteobacteria bacterium]